MMNPAAFRFLSWSTSGQTSSRHIGWITLAAGCALFAGSAVGQIPSSLPPSSTLKKLSLDQLLNIEVVSVSKRPEKLADTASAIQVITADDIRLSGATRLPEALRLATNLEVAQIDSRQWAISARGFNNTTANKMLVLMDGRMLYTPLYAGVFWDVQDTLMEDIDRIEVISGPGATQWGANAVNGVINIISKSARETQGGLLLGGAGNELRALGGARYGGEAAPGVFYRVYAKYFDRDQSVQPNGRGWPDSWHMAQTGFRIDWEKDSGSTLTVQGDGYGGKIAQPGFANVAVSGGNVLGRWSRTLDVNSDVRLQVYFDHTHRRIPGSITADIDIHDLDFQHRFPVADAHDLVWGLGYRGIADEITNAGALAFLPRKTTRHWFTGFVQDEIAVLRDQVHLTLGTKFEHNEYSGYEVQPSARAAWKLTKKHTIWAAVSRAVRAPSRIDRELYSPAAPPYVLQGGPNFNSEKLIAYELGYRVQPTPRTALSIATFYHDYDDLRSLEPVTPPAAFPVVIANGIRGNTHGMELTADFQVNDAWRLQAGWTELRVHSEAKPGSFDRTSVRSQSLDPNHQVRLRSVLAVRGDLDFDVSARYVSPIANQSVPDYTELDARLSWRPHPLWELSLVGQNLLHRHHAEFGPVGTRHEIERSVFGKAVWRF
jgi:iron complex outermembrane recepter protein